MKTFTAFFLLLASLSLHAQPAAAQNDSPCNQGRDLNDPRNANAICFPEIARITVTTSCQYGRNIYALGDVNHDSLADWIVGQVRCDTLHPTGGHPEEILLYKGVRGGLPAVASGERIGPTEIASSTAYLASGDWDSDGNIDIACRIQLFGDTTLGSGYTVYSVVIFWGQNSGHFTLNDTTRLRCGTLTWPLVGPSLSADLDGDHVADLALVTYGEGGNQGPVFVHVPQFSIFRGTHRMRWGKGNGQWLPNVGWWNRPSVVGLGIIDQDGDGNLDVIFYAHESAGTGYVSVLYGRPGGLPDTNDIQTIDLHQPNGQYSLFEDVTGDGIPELLVHTGVTDERVKVYLGLKGQRLAQQFGSGDDPPHPDKPQWWGKPWAELWLPNRIQNNWSRAHIVLFDFGDGNRDGVGDIWAYSWPYLLCYSGGKYLDSLVDGLLDTQPASGPGANALLGDIDGSGVPAMAMGTGSGIIYFKASASVPRTGRVRAIPDGTGPATVDPETDGEHGNSIDLCLLPNPARDEIHLTWNPAGIRGEAIIILCDLTGAELRRVMMPEESGSATISTAGLPRGICLVTLLLGGKSSTTSVVLN